MKKTKKIILNLLLLVAIGVFLYSGGRLAHIYYQNYLEKQERLELQSISKIPEDITKPFKVDWKALKAKNEDIIAWILVPGTNINYPVVQGPDNAYYLHRTFEKKDNYAGAIFMDYRVNPAFKDFNTLIYGHNMAHKTMFTDIEKFKEKEFFDHHDELYIFTPKQNYRGKIFSIYTTNDRSDSYDLNQFDESDRLAYLDMVSKKSDFTRKMKFDGNEHIVTLSTCSHEEGIHTDLRLLLHASLEVWDKEVTNY